MQKILVPVDFSDAARNSAYYAAALTAQLPKVEIILLYTDIRVPKAIFLMDTVDPQIYEEVGREEEQLQRLQELKEAVGQRAKEGTAVTVISSSQTPFGAIREILPAQDSGLVIVGINAGETTIGSGVAETVRELHTPLLVVPAHVGFSPIRSLVLTCDLKDPVETIPINLLAAFLQALPSHQLYVVHVDANEEVTGAEAITEQSQLHHLLDQFNADYHYLAKGDIVTRIGDFARQNDVQLVIAIPRLHGFFHQLFNRSVSDEIAKKSSFPTLLLPPPQ